MYGFPLVPFPRNYLNRKGANYKIQVEPFDSTYN